MQMQTPPPLQNWLTPARATFAASLLLSLIAYIGGTLNRDGMLYVRAAQAFLDGGFASAKAVFSWPYLSIAMAAIAKLTGLTLDQAGYLLNALFMAGACALVVACAGRRQAEAVGFVALAVLAIPGLNEYRNELIREYGCWFFVMLAFWLALRWDEQPRWPTAIAIQATLVLAALFRPEALTLFAALVGWQLVSAPKGERGRRMAMLGLLPAIGGMAMMALFLGGQLGNHRLGSELSRINVARFDAKAEALAASLIDYARGQARTILFWGSLALIPIKVLQKTGLLLLPLAYLFIAHQTRTSLSRYALFAWGIGVHLLVLCIFVTDQQFLAGRYVGPILLFSAPFAGYGLWLMSGRFPKWKRLIVGTTLVLMLANVVSLAPGKTHFIDAGKWLAQNAARPERVYLESGRTAHYAGWLNAEIVDKKQRATLVPKLSAEQYDLIVLEHSRKDPPLGPWIENHGLRLVERFDHSNGDAVVIVAPAGLSAGKSGQDRR